MQGPTGTLVLGILLILLTFVLPGGIVAGVRQLKARVVRTVPAPPPGTSGPTSEPGSDAGEGTESVTVGDEDLAPQS